MNRTYTELSRLHTLEERYKYLALYGQVGEATFGFDRWMNQQFYTSREWRNVRRDVIARDAGCDLGIEDFKIHKGIYIHHMNPLTVAELTEGDPRILDPEYLISVSHNTHNAIHYGDKSQLPKPFVPRRPGDTKLW